MVFWLHIQFAHAGQFFPKHSRCCLAQTQNCRVAALLKRTSILCEHTYVCLVFLRFPISFLSFPKFRFVFALFSSGGLWVFLKCSFGFRQCFLNVFSDLLIFSSSFALFPAVSLRCSFVFPQVPLNFFVGSPMIFFAFPFWFLRFSYVFLECSSDFLTISMFFKERTTA